MIAHLPTQPSVLPFEHARIIRPFSGFEPSLSRPTHTHTYLMVNEWKNITKTITHRTHKHVLSERLPAYKSDNPRIEYTTQHNMAIKPAARTSKEAMFTRVHSSVPSFGSFRPYHFAPTVANYKLDAHPPVIGVSFHLYAINDQNDQLP
ncbi:hypothetical protein ACTXT7_010358 [Hymenolepis weldensis]